MPGELRILTFSLEELMWAIYNLAERTNRIQLHGDIRNIELEETDTVTARLIFNAGKETVLGTPELAAVLIHHCIRTHVPLPTGAEKHLRVRGGELELLMAFGMPKEEALGQAAAE
jgi:hypothetical protein